MVGVAQGYGVRPDYEQRKPMERSIPYTGTSEQNPYFKDVYVDKDGKEKPRAIARNFVVVETSLYENEQMEQFIMNREKMKLFLKFVFVGLIMLGYGLI
jgi:hypothetical protein